MKTFKIKPEVFMFDDIAEFCNEFAIGGEDLILTNEYIYEPFFAKLNLKADVIFQEKYGAGEPSDEMVEAVYADMKKPYKRLFAIGGGTIIDMSKVLALKNVTPVLDLYDGKAEIVKAMELVLVPTTCGTGSEMTSVGVLELKSRHTKLGLASEEMFADKAVLIPKLVETLPYRFFATSSIDALIHCIESALSPKANAYSQLFSYEGIKMILKGYMTVVAEGEEARMPLLEDFLVASSYSGVAFGNAGCGAVHATSYPVGAEFHVAHGEINYGMLMGVLKTYIKRNPDGEIKKLNSIIAECIGADEKDPYPELENLLNKILQRKPLREYGVTPEDLEKMTDTVMTKQGRLMANNYVVLSREDVLNIYKQQY